MKSFGLTDRGTVRKDNQDSFILEKCRDSLIAGLCDGMGGAKAGGLASQLSNKAFVAYIYAKLTARGTRSINYEEMLKEACSEANGVAYEYSRFSEEFNGMGTTIVGGVIKSNGKGHIINIGDSRAYLISRRGETIRQITRDHSLVEDLVEYGAITREQALTHPQRNVITRALGSDATVEADYFEFELQSGDVLLLCSDGLSKTVDKQELAQVLQSDAPLKDKCSVLVEKANAAGGPDNITVLISQNDQER